MTAQIGEGNGYGTMEELNKHIRTLMKGENVLKPATIKLMQKAVSAANRTMDWALHTREISATSHGARLGFLNSMHYDPITMFLW
jgi:D-alanyl-D-alanine carboxypeptidase